MIRFFPPLMCIPPKFSTPHSPPLIEWQNNLFMAIPQFPFEKIAKKLTWLADYLDSVIKFVPSDMEPFLMPILVFARARTSTLQYLPWLKDLRTLTKRLNSALHTIGEDHHKVELVLRGPLVTCAKRSPIRMEHAAYS